MSWVDVENSSVQWILHLKVGKTYHIQYSHVNSHAYEWLTREKTKVLNGANNSYMHLFDSHLSPPWNR